jgi:thioredoxin 1
MPTIQTPLTQVDDDHFATEVLESDVPVVVDFWAPWCAPCRVMHPVLDELARERPDLAFRSIDIDENQRTAVAYRILSAPTLIVFRGGEPVLTLVGARPKRRLAQELATAGV